MTHKRCKPDLATEIRSLPPDRRPHRQRRVETFERTQRQGGIFRWPLGLLTVIGLSAGLSTTGCHEPKRVSIDSVNAIYYPIQTSMTDPAPMGAGDALGWHLVQAEPGSQWVIRATPHSIRKLDTDPFIRHNVTAVYDAAIDPVER